MRQFSAREAYEITQDAQTKLENQELDYIFQTIANACDCGYFDVKVDIKYPKHIQILRTLGYSVVKVPVTYCSVVEPMTYLIKWDLKT